MRNLRLAALASLATLLLGGLAFACGDKLMLTVGAARARQIFRSHAASILAYAPPDSPVSRVIKDIASQTAMQRAGRKFSVVEDQTKLQEALKGAKYDLLIADVSQMEALQQQLRSAPKPPILLPVVYGASKVEARVAQKRFRRILKAPDAPGRYVESIDDALELRLRDGGSN